ncbi:ATPase, partial [Mesorhizobium sp. M7A.F.Ca.US.014.04.1.1]
VHDGFARKAMPAIAMAGAGCRLSLGLRAIGKPIAANAPRLLRAA